MIDNDIENTGLVYLLTNPSMPGLVKIGITFNEDVKIRMMQLYSTGVPLPFECAYAAKVKDPQKVELAFHTAFSPNRINPKREYFEIEPAQAIALLKLLELSDATIEVSQEKETVDSVELNAGKEFARKRPRFDFITMGIPIGSELIFVSTGETSLVRTNKTVEFRGQEMSLTSATRQALGEGYAYNIAPGPYWTFNGRRLRDIYNETYIMEV